MCCPVPAEVTHVETAAALSEGGWTALNQRLRDNGFAGMPLQHQPQSAAAQSGHGHSQGHQQPLAPNPDALYAALDKVLTQYDRRARLVQELLAATDLARERESRVDAALSRLRK